MWEHNTHIPTPKVILRGHTSRWNEGSYESILKEFQNNLAKFSPFWNDVQSTTPIPYLCQGDS